MSTKNLARTVIEGGRAWHNCWERRNSNGVERSWEAQTSARLRTAIEVEELVYRPRQKVYACFRDKLGPAERWLAAQAGRPWMAGRRVGQRGQAFFWFVQTDSGAFRQTQRLTPTEVARFVALPKSYRNQSDAFQTPAHPEQ